MALGVSNDPGTNLNLTGSGDSSYASGGINIPQNYTLNPNVTGDGTVATAGPSGGDPAVLGTSTTVDPAVAAQQAADTAKAAALRTNITALVNQVKSIFNSRYGQVDASAGEQVGNLNDRYGNESQDLTQQVTDQNQLAGAGAAGRGVYDSSYRGNTVDQITNAGQGQIRDLGTELRDNINKIAQWVASQKAGFDSSKNAADTIASHSADSTDPTELAALRDQLDTKIADLQAGSADNNTSAQNASALATIAPSSARTVQLKTTLAQIVAGNADPSSKATIGNRLITSSGLSPEDQQKLTQAFQADLSAGDQPKDPTQTA